MSCPICNTSPCICKDSYYQLTDEGFLKHLSNIGQIAKDRGLNIAISINDIDIDDYIRNAGITTDASVSLTNMLTAFVDMPNYFMQRLVKHKDQPVVNFVKDLKDDFDFIGFPLLIATYAVLKRNAATLRQGLIRNFYHNIVTIDYELNPPITPYGLDDFMKNSLNAEEFNMCLYAQRTAYERMHKAASDGLPSANAVAEALHKYRTGMRCIEEILSTPKTAITRAIEFLCIPSRSGDKLFDKYCSTKGIDNSLRDALQNANYAFCKEFQNVLTGNLKV